MTMMRIILMILMVLQSTQNIPKTNVGEFLCLNLGSIIGRNGSIGRIGRSIGIQEEMHQPIQTSKTRHHDTLIRHVCLDTQTEKIIAECLWFVLTRSTLCEPIVLGGGGGG